MHLGTRLLAKTKPNSVSSTAIEILVTCTKYKKWKFSSFLACLLATSERMRNADFD